MFWQTCDLKTSWSTGHLDCSRDQHDVHCCIPINDLFSSLWHPLLDLGICAIFMLMVILQLQTVYKRRKYERLKPDASFENFLDDFSKAILNMANKRVGLCAQKAEAVMISGIFSGELLETIFNVPNPINRLHDGAAVIRLDEQFNPTIYSANLSLPMDLDKKPKKQRYWSFVRYQVIAGSFLKNNRGNRHRAAWSFSIQHEKSLCVIVSEETGGVSITVAGELHKMFTKRQIEVFIKNISTRALLIQSTKTWHRTSIHQNSKKQCHIFIFLNIIFLMKCCS
uniref:DAC domain-containing protein n=1 Tax=Ditylenchus dipsaci TaxID=166011 RepID=A0A915EM99_9BILA